MKKVTVQGLYCSHLFWEEWSAPAWRSFSLLQSGTETRRKIKELTDDVKEKATDYAGTAKGKVVSTVDKAKELYEEKKSAISAAVEAGKEAYEKEVAK